MGGHSSPKNASTGFETMSFDEANAYASATLAACNSMMQIASLVKNVSKLNQNNKRNTSSSLDSCTFSGSEYAMYY